MKNKSILTTIFLVLTLCAFSFKYDPDSWTTCITNGTTMNGESVPNNYFCNTFDGNYNGEPSTLSRCETSGIGDGGGCSGNSLGFYPAMLN